jgi:hypothetical protein
MNRPFHRITKDDPECGAALKTPNAFASFVAGLSDSGAREADRAGGAAVREPEGERGDFTLLPFEAMRVLAAHFTKGGVKYGDPHNYRKGLRLTRCLSSALRHLMQYAAGMSDEDHLAAAGCNVVMALQLRADIEAGRLPTSLDDRFKP